MNVFELFAKLGLDTSEYEKGLEGAESKGAKFGAGLKAAAGVTAGVITATAAATVASAKAFVSGAAEVATYGDNIDKTSQRLGISAEKYQEWDYAMQIAGTSMDNMQMGMKTLTNQLDSAKNGSADAIAKFEALGISMEDLATMSREEVFEAAIYGFQNMADSTERAALANDLFGRSGQELTPLFNMTNEETQKLIASAEEYGMVMSDEAVAASAGFQDSLTTMQNTMAGMKNNMMANFLPSLTTAMDGLSNIFSGVDMEGGLAQIEEGIKGLADGIVSKAPEIFAIGGSIIEALASSIADNLPTLLDAAVPVIGQLITTIVGLAPTLVDALFTLVNSVLDWLVNGEGLSTIINGIVTLITSIATSLAQNISTIIPMIVQGILTVITTLTSPEVMVPMLQAGITLLLELVKGILSAIPVIIEQLPVIIENIVNTLLEGLPLVIEAAIQIFMALVEAIPVIIEALVEALPSIITTIIEGLMNAIPMILDGAIQMLMAIIQAIPTIIMALVENLPKIIMTIVNTLIENIPVLIQGAIQLFMGIIQAIPLIIVELIKNLPQIIVTIVQGIMSGFGQIVEVGANLIKGLWEGIKNVGKWLWDKISGFFSGIFDKIKGFFGIHSPSTLFRDEIGKNMALGIGEGFTDEMDTVGNQMIDSASGLAEDISDAMQVDPMDLGDYTVGASSMGSAMKTANSTLLEGIGAYIDSKLEKMEFTIPVYIGGKKIDQQIVMANARNAVISGGR